jgi:hypothetical protein
MKIEAKKNKYNLNKHQQKRPEKATMMEPAPAKPARKKKAPEKQSPEKPSAAKPEFKLPKIRLPKIKLPRIALPKLKLPAFRLPALKVPKFKVKGIALLIIAAPALLLAVWLGMNLRRHAVPKPLFTASNLPPAPPADTNGYSSLYDDQIYNEYFNKDMCDINLFRNASSMEAFLDKTRGEYAMARELAGRDDVKKMIGLYRDIIKMPQFADMVVPDLRDQQKVRVFCALHNSITALLITRLQEKKYGAAFKILKDQMILNIQYMKSARSMTNYLSSIQLYDKTLNIMKSILNQFAAIEKKDAEAVAACKEIGAMLQSFNPQTISLAPIVTFEYIISWKQTFDPALQQTEAAFYQGIKYKRLVFFDRGLTEQMYNERWKNIYEIAKKPIDVSLVEVRKIQDQKHAAGRFWWFRNAVGKKYLDNIAMPVYQLFPESKNVTTAIIQRQGEIITLISTLKEEIKPAVKQDKKQVKKPKKKQAPG